MPGKVTRLWIKQNFYEGANNRRLIEEGDAFVKKNQLQTDRIEKEMNKSSLPIKVRRNVVYEAILNLIALKVTKQSKAMKSKKAREEICKDCKYRVS